MATSNTGVIIKRSFITAIPPYLEPGELAYSYVSNTFFIGSPTSDGVLNVGGRFYTQTIDSATPNLTANTLVKRDANGQFYGAVLNNINGLTPGYYGGQTAIPVIQVSANGLITSVSNSVFSQPDTANLVNGIYRLSLGSDGKLTFPDSTIQNTAFTGTAIDQFARNTANSSITGSAIDQYARDTANNSSSGSAVDQYARDTANSSITGSAIDQFARNRANTDVTNVSLVGSSIGSSTQIPVIGYAANGRIISAGVTSPQIGTGSVRGVLQLNDSVSSTSGVSGANAATPLAVKTAYDYAQVSFDQSNAANILAQSAYDKANNSITADQYARDTANAATNNITILQGVNNTQNNNITILQSVNNTQNNDISILYGINLTQNNSITVLQGVDVTQNSRITSTENLVESSYNQANAAFTQANIGATFINTGGTVSGNVLFTRDLSVTGNLYVLGNTTTINTSSLSVQDALITLGVGNYTTDLLDIGFAGHYNAGTNAHAGIIRDASAKEFFVFDGYTPELSSNNNIDINNASFNKANLNAGIFKGNLIGSTAVVNGIELYSYTTNAYDKANTVGTLVQASFDVANTAAANTVYQQSINNTQNTNITSVNTYASNAYDKANSANVLAQAAFDKANTAAAGSIDQYARDAANSAIANTIYTQGVDLTQNTDITSINTLASSAFDKANSTNVLAQAAFNVANTDVTHISLVGSSVGSSTQIPVIGYAANGRIVSAGVASPQTASGSVKGVVELSDSISSTSGVSGANAATPLAVKTTYDYTQSSFDTANSAVANTVYTQGVDATQNTNIINVNTFAGSAYDKANSANVLAQSAFDKANSAASASVDQYARDTANTSTDNIAILQGVNTTQNNNITLIQGVDNTQNNNITAINIYATSAYGHANAAFDKANTGITADQYARDTANSAVANTIYTQGVDLTQNTNITYATTFAGSAYDKANSTGVLAQAAFDKANTGITSDQYARDTANSAVANTIYTQGVDTTQNTNISSVNTFAGSAFDKANSANVLAQAAFDKANNSISADQYARDTANSASANTVYTQGVDVTQNTNITTVTVLAQAAFDKANTGVSTSTDQYARDTANSASSNTIYTQSVDVTQNTNITTATVLAQAAFDKANTAASGSIDQYARDTANTAASNTVYQQSVNNTQNTNINAVNTYATAGFGHANAAFTAANNRVLKTGDTITGSLNVNSNISSTKPNTGSLLVIGGVGVSDSIYVGNRVGFSNTSNVSMVYQYYNAATNSLDTVFE